MRDWASEDSAAWSHQQDSVARALARHGGDPIACPTTNSEPEGSEDRSVILSWRFPEQDVRVIATRVRWSEPPASGVGASRWWIQISGYPVGFSGCDPAVRVRRWLTPREMLAAVWERFES